MGLECFLNRRNIPEGPEFNQSQTWVYHNILEIFSNRLTAHSIIRIKSVGLGDAPAAPIVCPTLGQHHRHSTILQSVNRCTNNLFGFSLDS